MYAYRSNVFKIQGQTRPCFMMIKYMFRQIVTGLCSNGSENGSRGGVIGTMMMLAAEPTQRLLIAYGRDKLAEPAGYAGLLPAPLGRGVSVASITKKSRYSLLHSPFYSLNRTKKKETEANSIQPLNQTNKQKLERIPGGGRTVGGRWRRGGSPSLAVLNTAARS